MYKLLCFKVGSVHFYIKNIFCYILKMRREDPKKVSNADMWCVLVII